MDSIQISSIRILVYQNEKCDALIEYLKYSGFSVIQADDNIIDALYKGNYDICILDYFNNSPDDLNLLYTARKINKNIPVIFVSNLHNPSYIINALNSGVDDYIVKPCNLEELVCRVKNLLRRCDIKVRDIKQIYKIGDYMFNVEMCTLSIGSSEIKLTAKQNKTLAFLCAYKNEVLPREILLRGIWRNDNYFNKRSLDVHICHLRNFLSQDKNIKINTIRGIGYSLAIKEENI